MDCYRGELTVALALLISAGTASATAAAEPGEIVLHEGTVLRFAKAREGSDLLKRHDRYLNAQSPLDRQLRRQTDAEVSKNEFAEFSAEQALAWLAPQRAAITRAVAVLAERWKGWRLPWPPVITLVHTTGREEGDSAYCRGATIALSTQRLFKAQPEDQLEHLLAHELFHVLSSHNPELRKALYEIIGFTVCNEIALPPELAARKITNPDAPTIDCYLEVRRPDVTWHLAPVLISKRDRYTPEQSTELFDYISFQLLEVEQRGERWRPLLRDGQPVLHKPASVPEFAEQIGGNTGYIIHPDEVLAENFALLVAGKRDVPTPRILEAMAKLLGPAASEGK
jgi:hypothetical protein